MKYYLSQIHMGGNEGVSYLRKDVLYAELRNERGELEISATLDHVLGAIRDRRLDVEGVEVIYTDRGSRVYVRAPR